MKERIETVIDRLLEYVTLNGNVSIKKTSAALGLEPAQVERLALLLEENGLMQVRYGLFGATLTVKEVREEKQKSADSESRVKKAQKLEEEILKTENLMAFFEKDLERRIIQAEELLDELEKKAEFTSEELELIRKEVDAALGQLAAFSDQIRELGEKEQAFYEKLISFKQKISKIQGRDQPQKDRAPWESLLHWLEKLWPRVPLLPSRPVERMNLPTPPITFEPTPPQSGTPRVPIKNRPGARKRRRH